MGTKEDMVNTTLRSTTFCLLFIVAVSPPCVLSVVGPSVYTKDDSGPYTKQDGKTITITPSQTFDIFCDGQSYFKKWYKVDGQSRRSIPRLMHEVDAPDVYQINTQPGSFVVTLRFKPFQLRHTGEYKCEFTSNSQTITSLSVFLAPAPTPSPQLFKVQDVTIATVRGSSPVLRVSWRAVSGSGITYTVCYSTTSGTQSDPPSSANCGTSEINGTSTTLGPLSRGTIYYIWVTAVSSGGRGPYSHRTSAVVEPRMYTNDASEGEVDLENGKTITITPSKTYDIWCSDTRYVKDWYRVDTQGDRSISRSDEYSSVPGVYATNPASHVLALHVKSFQSTDSGEYECRLRSNGLPTLSVFLTPSPVPIPMMPSEVTVTRTVQGSSPALRVSWSAVSGRGITYTVCYSTTSGTQSDPPSNANCDTSGITGTSTTLGPLSRGTTYYIWVAAVSSGRQGPYSDRRQRRTHDYAPPPRTVTASPLPESGKINVSWTPPTPPTGSTITGYSIQYRIGSSGDYTTATVPGSGSTSTTISGLQLGGAYEVSVGALTEIGVGPSSYQISHATTYNVPGNISKLSIQSSESGGNRLSLTVTWSAPQSDVPITRYEGNYRTLPSRSWTGHFLTETRQHIHRNLLTGKNYEVRVRAVSAIGNGIYTKATTSFPTISSLKVLNSTNCLKLMWTSSAASDFNLLYWTTETPSNITTISANSSPYNITKLESNTHYKVQLIAQNEEGTTKSSVFDGCTTPEDPSSIGISTLSSTSIKMQWTPPPNSDRLPLTYHVNYTGMSRPTTSTTLNLTGLHPYEEYTISVRAGNDGGLSVPVTGTARTYSDKPRSKPINRTLIAKSSRWCFVSWKIPQESGRNGIIIRYIIELNNMNGKVWNITHELNQFNFSSPANVTHNLTNLTPFTTYKWRVAAATVNGTGRFTPNEVDFRTRPDVPGPVFVLLYKEISSESVNISWSAPMEPNGVIKGYNVSYREIGGNASGEFTVGPDDFHKVLNSLKIHTPYKVTVTAKTRVGAGVPSFRVVFSEQGVPTKPVENVVAFRVDSERVNISWTPLSLVEARGIPLYTVFYMSDNGVTRGVNTTKSSVIIPELNPRRTYIFTIRVSTGNGTGETTAQVTLPGDEPTAKGGGATSAVAAVVAVLLVVVIAAIIAICIVVCFRRRQKATMATSAMMPVRCEKKGGDEYSLGIDSGGKADVASILGELPVMADGGQKIISKKSFLAVTKQLHLNRDRGFEEEFKTIVNDPNGSDVIAKANRRKNRYGNITTYDHCRVVLSVPDENGSDYINASYINGYAIENAYIASQGPTPNTVSDFWQMLWDQECPVIVMLTKVEEKGKKKCHQYWEDELLKPYEPGRELEVTVTSVKGYANYDVREITLSNPSSGHSRPHKLKQFHYTGWPDHGVPTHPSSLVKFAQQVRREYRDSTAPLLVHCSAGVGRTGTFITIDAMLERLQEKDNLNIYQFVTAMRTRRTFMVQTMEQYAFIHDALCDYLMCGDTSVAAHELRMEIQSLHQADAKTRKSGFQQKFELLDTVSKKPVSEDESFSRKTAVVKKNRYKDKFPYSNCFVRAPGKGPTGGADYINASYIDSYSRNKAFIAAQAPLESTKSDVWEMIWQYRPSTVVVLCDFQKERQEACSRFWPDEREKTLNVGFLKVNNECTERDTTYDVTRLEVFDSRKESSKVLNVSLFHLKDWDKDGRPTTEAVLRLMGDVQNTTASPSGDVIPAVVMCDDGMGRSGVFICAMSEVERVKVEGQVDVFQTIKGMRIQRPHMVETPDQYKLCFEILQSYLDSFDTYANFKAV